MRIPAYIFILSSLAAYPQATGPVSEYRLKAELLGRIGEFTIWPSDSPVKDKLKPFRIGVLGHSPFDNHLNQTWEQQTLLGKSVQIRYLNRVQEIEECDVLFISSSESDRLAEILGRIKNKAILTVGDTPSYALRGVMVNFFFESKRIRMEVNLSPLHAAGLNFSSHMLKRCRVLD